MSKLTAEVPVTQCTSFFSFETNNTKRRTVEYEIFPLYVVSVNSVTHPSLRSQLGVTDSLSQDHCLYLKSTRYFMGGLQSLGKASILRGPALGTPLPHSQPKTD